MKMNRVYGFKEARIKLYWRMLEISDRITEIGFAYKFKIMRLALVTISNQIDRGARFIAPSEYLKTKLTYAFGYGSADPIPFEPGARRYVVRK